MLSQEDYNILRLYRSKGVGPITFLKLLDIYGSCGDVIKNIDDFNFQHKSHLIIKSQKEIDAEIKNTYDFGAKIITYQNIDYPTNLKNIYDFPIVLTVCGDVNLLKNRCISMVGARNASINGCNFAQKISKELNMRNFVIVSGMAIGIDSSAHFGSLDNGTIAVLGTGINIIYPLRNKNLYENIKKNGLLITEYPFNTLPKAENFPLRNRIISGLSEAVVIIEAGEKSGTLITAKQAIEQGRELFVVPGNPYDYRSKGCNQLIKEGANVLTSAEDIFDALNLTNSSVNLANTNNDIITKQDITKCDKIEQDILSKLNYTPIDIDTLFNNLNIDITQFNSKLVELELQNKIIIKNGFVKLS